MNNLKNGKEYTLKLKTEEIIIASFHLQRSEIILPDLSVTFKPDMNFPSEVTCKENIYKDCFVYKNRILNNNEIDSILIDNTWYLLVE